MTTLGRYKIESRLGEGAMADVYRAHDPEIGRTVAIKVLKPQFARDGELNARFLREARAAGALNHAHIATIYDVGEADGAAYIAMELVDGRPLDEVLHAQGRIAYERVLLLSRQLADALDYAHRAGVVHRDIKPSNILISADGSSAKLVDFGVARVGESDAAGLARTQVGQIVGTPRYMSPEQALGLPVDSRSDLFSLGVVLYEMVTGKVAFPGTGLATLAIQIAQDNVAPIGSSAADCPSGLRFIIDKLLAKKPEQRFADGAALVASLDRELRAFHEPAATRRGLQFRFKLPLVLFAFTAITLGASVLAVRDREQRALEEMAVVSGRSIAGFVTANAAVVAADNAGLPSAEQDWASLQAFVATAASDRGVRDIVVADVDGVIRASNRPALVGQRYRASTGEAPLEHDRAVTIAPDVGAGEGLRFVKPIDYAGARFGTLDLVVTRSALDRALATSTVLLAALSAAVMLVVLLIGYLSGAMVTRPLRTLRAALDDAVAQDFALRISHKRSDEFGEVFDAFNRTVAHLETRGADATAQPAPSVLATRIAA